MCNVLDRFHHLDFGYEYDDKAFHTNHPFYVKDIASFSHKNHILHESTRQYMKVHGQNSAGKLQISYDEKAQKSHILCQ